MCLDIVYRGKRKKRALTKLPKSGYYWKVVIFDGKKYSSPIFSEFGSYKIGWNTTKPKIDYAGYRLAYHLYRTKKTAERMKRGVSVHGGEKKVIVRCKVKRKDIINIGIQDDGLCIVTKRIWMPKPKKKKIA